MALFLVQHGKSLAKDVDPAKGLSDEGISEVKRISEVAKNYNVQVSSIKHSGKKRALQTSEIFEKDLEPEEGISRRNGLAPLDDVVAYAEKIDSEEDMMLVSHLPFLERLTSYLVTGSQDKNVFKFQNGGIVCLDIDPETDSWVIIWTLMPNIG